MKSALRRMKRSTPVMFEKTWFIIMKKNTPILRGGEEVGERGGRGRGEEGRERGRGGGEGRERGRGEGEGRERGGRGEREGRGEGERRGLTQHLLLSWIHTYLSVMRF